MSDAKKFAHTVFITLLVIALYNSILKNFLPNQVQGWIGIGL